MLEMISRRIRIVCMSSCVYVRSISVCVGVGGSGSGREAGGGECRLLVSAWVLEGGWTRRQEPGKVNQGGKERRKEGEDGRTQETWKVGTRLQHVHRWYLQYQYDYSYDLAQARES